MLPDATDTCPYCRAENLPSRRSCWRCERSLPTQTVLSAEHVAQHALLADTRPGMTAEAVGAEGEAAGAAGPSRRLRWFLGKHSC